MSRTSEPIFLPANNGAARQPPSSLENDIAHVGAALRRMHDPMLRYLVAQLIDLFATRIQELEEASQQDAG